MTQLVRLDAKGVLGWGNRGSLDIIDLILLVCMNGTMKTHIMYKCNLNSKQVQEYLELLLKYELLERIDSPGSKRSLYKSTDRGKRFVNAYAELFEIFDLINVEQRH